MHAVRRRGLRQSAHGHTETAPDGTFTLVNVPAGADIPLVIQLGRWRRQVTIPSVAACESTALPTSLTRMPRNHTEGDIPLIAVATGEADQTECVLMKMGIDQAEFTQPSGGGRVQLYLDNGSDLGPGTPLAEQLYSQPETLALYDMVVLPCVGMPVVEVPSNQQNLIAYTSGGGRVFASHYSYAWLKDDPPFSGTAEWIAAPNPNAPSSLVGTINTSFVEGQNFATWLQAVSALSAPDEISLDNVRYDLVSIVPPTDAFIVAPDQVLQMGFYTPVGQPASTQCGRVVFTDFHVSGTANVGDAGLSDHTTFPSECTAAPLTPQEKALEFMLFDLASCVPPAPESCTPLTCEQQSIDCGPAGDGCGGQSCLRGLLRDGHVRRRRRLRAVRLPGRGLLHTTDVRPARVRLRRQRRRVRRDHSLRKLHASRRSAAAVTSRAPAASRRHVVRAASHVGPVGGELHPEVRQARGQRAHDLDEARMRQLELVDGPAEPRQGQLEQLAPRPRARRLLGR